MNSQHSHPINFFVLADSHGRPVKPLITTSSFNIFTRAISGLKWTDNNNQRLSVHALLSSPDIQRFFQQSHAILFIVGTNSVRSMPARRIIPQVEQIIQHIQQTYPQLNQDGKIAICSTFPCLKRTVRFSTRYLTRNINQYNEQLILLSAQMKFSVVDFHIIEDYLRRDGMHVHDRYDYLIPNSIISHFSGLIPPPPSITTYSNPPLPSASASTLNQEIISQSSTRTREAVAHRNKQRHQKLKVKQQQHMIKRTIYNLWTIPLIKQYLQSCGIRYGRILPIFNKTLRLHFNSQKDLEFAEGQLGSGIFNEDHYQEYMNNQEP